MTSATVEADVVITAAPETRTGRRACDAPGSQSTFAFAVAKDAHGTKFELFGLSPTAMAALGKLGAGDHAHIRGAIAARVDNGVPILLVNIQVCTMCLPIAKARPKAAHCGRGTRLASQDGVAAAQSAWLARANRLGGSE